MLRWLIGLAALACSAPALAGPDAQRLDDHTRLIPGTFESGRQPDGNSILIEGADGMLVFDTGRHPAQSDAIAAAVKASGKKLTVIVNSHWHLDHVSGNLRLKTTFPGVKVYASDAIDEALTGFLKSSAADGRAALEEGKLPATIAEDVTADLRTIDNGQQLRPDVVIAADGKLPLKGRKLQVHIARKAATAGDLWLYDSQSKRVLAGDLVTLPVPFLDTACPQGWIGAMKAIWDTDFTSLVPGHGPVMTRDDFAFYRQGLTDFITCATAETPMTTCTNGWAATAGRFIGADKASKLGGFAGYYGDLIRQGKLAKYC